MIVCVHGRCLFRPPNELVPEDLIIGLPGQLNDQGVFESHAVFDWSKAVSDYSYEVVESLPAQGATNASLGSTNDRAPDEQTVLAIFKRVPGSSTGQDEPLENYDTYTIKLRVFSDCAAGNYVTEASYTIDLTATYEFTHNFSQADAIFSPQGWQQRAQLIVHTDLHREFTARFSTTRVSPLSLDIHIETTNHTMACNVEWGALCFVNVTFDVRRDNPMWYPPFNLTYYVSQYFVNSENMNMSNRSLPNNFDVQRQTYIQENDTIRYDMCYGRLFTNRTNEENLEILHNHTVGNQTHDIKTDSIHASCTFRIDIMESISPLAFVVAWAYPDHDTELVAQMLNSIMT
jgi:hypothetical protein